MRRTTTMGLLLLGLLARSQAAPAAPAPLGPAPALGKEDGGLTLSARAVLVLKTSTGEVLLARRPHELRSIASLTKLAAALVVRRHGLQLKAGTTIDRQDWQVALGGARTRLELNWTYRNQDLLYAALLSSDNRAVSALGRAVGLDAAGLVRGMNVLAKELGLSHTHFAGPVGIDPRNVSTALELGRLVDAASRDPALSEVMRSQAHRVTPLRGYLSNHYRNTNPLVGQRRYPRFLASKTGYNAEAGYCLAVVVEQRALGHVAIVLLGSRSKAWRLRDQETLLRWLNARPR
ncbi:MAG: D-alanyl-D-alanine carboxypeptidase [Proteobacteria bacterium]|nr:D-alanyl-D-alanine carboxypeptidase [Pseudomonadota bacterium]